MKAITWVKMLVGGGAMCIGGPALVYYVTPSEEEIVSRYNPQLRKRAMEARQERQEDFDKFVTRLKDLSKSDKPLWTAWDEDNERRRLAAIDAQRAAEVAANARRDEMKNSIR